MDHLLTEQQLEVKAAIREFAEKEIRPSVAARDESGEFPVEICRKLGELGFMGVNTPEAMGGAGMDTVTYAIIVEELSRVDPAVGVVISVNNSLICYPLEKFANTQQKEAWLKPLAEGKLLGAFCVDRTVIGLRRGGAEDDRRPRRRYLDAERHEELHYQRPQRHHAFDFRAHR